MLKDFTISNLLDLNETIAKDLFEGKTYPWEVLPEIGDFILKLGQTLSEEEYDHPSEDVWIAKSAKVAPTACINGPVIIGKEAEVRHCAFIRGKAIIYYNRDATGQSAPLTDFLQDMKQAGWGDTNGEINFWMNFPEGPRKDATYFPLYRRYKSGAI